MSKQWYVLQTYSQFEMQVKRALRERIEREGLQEYFGEILIPSEEVVEIKDGKKRNSQRKFFPNYVLVEMEMNDATWHVVRSIPRVSGFVGGTAEKPAPIPAHEVARRRYLRLAKRFVLLMGLLQSSWVQLKKSCMRRAD